MKFRWQSEFDLLTDDKSQYQINFPEKNTVNIYRIADSIGRYVLVFPSLNRVEITTDIMSVYSFENLIRDSKNEDEFLNKYMVNRL